MKRIAIIALIIPALVAEATAQKHALSPTQTVIEFYQALKQKHYVEGFSHSIYRKAIEGLTRSELEELEPDFALTFSAIPDRIETRGEQITGDTAVVFLKFAGTEAPQQVALIRVNGEWLVGDKDGLTEVSAQGGSYFFNARILVNEDQTYELLRRMIDAELIYSSKFQGKNASMQELLRLGGVPKELESGDASGYRFALTLTDEGKTFFVTATPVAYGKSGKLSFYADSNGVRAEDLKGQAATAKSPSFQPK
jgi:hypothetical protein